MTIAGAARAGRPLPLAGMAAIAAAAVGLVLGFTVHIGFLLLAALGLFGPGLLREAGLLRDRDEFEIEAARYAGYRAYLAAGAFLVAMIVTSGWGGLSLDDDAVPASAVLALLLVVYFLSYLFSFWGPARAASRVLFTFGALWAGFVVLSHATEPAALLVELAVPLPLLLLAFTAARWPRPTGLALAALAAASFLFFDLSRAFAGNGGALLVLVLLFVPLIATGMALLAPGRRESAG